MRTEQQHFLQNRRLDDPALRWEGVVEMEFGPDTPDGPAWAMPWRIDRLRHRLFASRLVKRSRDAAGVRLALCGNTSSLTVGVDPCLEIEPMEPSTHWRFDLYVDGVLHRRCHEPRKPSVLLFDGWQPGTHRFELYCDIVSPIRFTSVAMDRDSEILPSPDNRPRWLVFGSSITQCGTCDGPGETWPAIVARQFDLNHTNLGYGGSAMLEPTVARMIAGLPADLISVCLSVNNYQTHTPRTWRAAVIGFLLSIRDGHPDTPIACVSPITSPPRETQPSPTGLTLPFMREQVRSAVDALRELGDDNLHYIDGSTIFGPEHVRFMPDQLHPDAEGCRVLARQYARHVMPLFGDVMTGKIPDRPPSCSLNTISAPKMDVIQKGKSGLYKRPK